MILDNSTIDLFNQCPRKYYLRSVLKFDREDIPSPLTFGGCWHEAMQWRAKGANLPAASIEFLKAYKDKMSPLNEGDIRTPEKGIEILSGYYTKYGDKDPWEYEQIELGFGIDLGSPPICLYTGRIDAVINMGRSRDVLDWKTTFQLGPSFLEPYSLDRQMLGYTWAARQYWSNIQGAWIDAVQVAKTKGGMIRERIVFRQTLLDQWVVETLQLVQMLQDCHEHNRWPKHSGGNCFRWGECQFWSLCTSGIEFTEQSTPPPGYCIRTWEPWAIGKEGTK